MSESKRAKRPRDGGRRKCCQRITCTSLSTGARRITAELTAYNKRQKSQHQQQQKHYIKIQLPPQKTRTRPTRQDINQLHLDLAPFTQSVPILPFLLPHIACQFSIIVTKKVKQAHRGFRSLNHHSLPPILTIYFLDKTRIQKNGQRKKNQTNRTLLVFG
jgi:hypothetical protein